jgi:hypothetical protein
VAGRADESAEQDREHLALGHPPPAAGEELLDLAEQRRAVARGRQVVDAVKLDVPRARDALGQVARVAHVDEAVARPAPDQRGDAQLAGIARTSKAVSARAARRTSPGLGDSARGARATRAAAVVGARRREAVEQRARSRALDHPLERVRALARVGTVRAGRGGRLDDRRVPHERAHRLRPLGGDLDRQRAAGQVAEQHGVLGAHRVEPGR